MPAKSHKRRRPATVVTVRCEWCGQDREALRRDTRTCSDRCRSRLSVYTRTIGYAPDELPGTLTALQAIDLEIHRLLMLERRRRAAIAAELAAYLAKRPAKKCSGLN